MSEALKFRRGLAKNLSGVTVDPGAIYITTDERAMYVDLPTEGSNLAKRIRVGNFVEYANLEALAAAGYYSTEALYLIDSYNHDDNNETADVTYALLKYIGEDTDGSAKFVHLNSTSSLSTELADLEEIVEGHTTSINALDMRLTTAEGEIDTLQGKVQTLEGTTIPGIETNITNLTKTVSDNKTEIEGKLTQAQTDLQAAIDDKVSKSEFTTELNKKVDTTTLTNYYTKTETDTEFVSHTELESYKYIDETELGNAKTEIQGKLDLKANQSDFNGLSATVGGHTTSIGAIEGKLQGIETTVIAYADSAAQTAVNTKVGEIGTDTVKEYVDNAINGITTGETSLGGRVTKVEQDLTNLTATVDNKVNQLDYNTKVAELEKGISDNKALIDNLDDTYATDQQLSSAVSTINGTITTLTGRVKANEDAITEHTASISANATAIQNLEDADDALDKKIDDLEDALDAKITAANAMTYKGTVADVGNLPTGSGEGAEKVNAGDTYVASAAFTSLLNDKQVYAGDLIIANADQGEAETYTGGWSIVDTGYIKAHESSLNVGSNTITLNSHLNQPLGSATFTSDSFSVQKGGIEITTSGTNINFDMVWGTF